MARRAWMTYYTAVMTAVLMAVLPSYSSTTAVQCPGPYLSVCTVHCDRLQWRYHAVHICQCSVEAGLGERHGERAPGKAKFGRSLACFW